MDERENSGTQQSVKGHSTLLKGAAILGIAAIISKLLGTLQKIPLQNIAGDEAFGIYSAVYPFYTLILFLATAGFPLAVSKFVSDAHTQGNEKAAKGIVIASSVILCGTGLVFFILLYFGAPVIANWIGSSQTMLAIRSVSFALLIVPFMSVLRGYFQGKQQMVPTAISQVIEQLIRVVTMLSLLLILTSYGYSSSWIAAGATFGSVTGAGAGFIVMWFYWMREKRRNAHLRQPVHIKAIPRTRYAQLAKYAIPICLGTIAMPIIQIMDTFTIPALLGTYGEGNHQVMQSFGVYARGLPLVQLVVMLFSSVSVALVPAIAEANMLKNHDSLLSRAKAAMKWSWLIGLAASVGIAVTALPLNIMLFEDSAGTRNMVLLGFTILFSVMNITASSIMQGMGEVKAPAIHLLVGAGLKMLGNLLFVPLYGIEGAAIAGILAYLCVVVLNIWKLRRVIPRSILSFGWIRALPAVLMMGLAVLLWIKVCEYGFHISSEDSRIEAAVVGLTSVGLGGLVYWTMLRWMKLISGISELKQLLKRGK